MICTDVIAEELACAKAADAKAVAADRAANPALEAGPMCRDDPALAAMHARIDYLWTQRHVNGRWGRGRAVGEMDRR